MKLEEIQQAIDNGELSAQQVYDRMMLDINTLRHTVKHREKLISERKAEFKRIKKFERSLIAHTASLNDRVNELKTSVDSLSAEKSKLLRKLKKRV